MTIGKLCYSCLLAAAVLSTPAQAALYDRGNGMIYDDVLNITWLQDANYAQTSGYDSDGVMTWDEANTWANQLVYGGYSDWRLPSSRSGNPTQLGSAINFIYGDYGYFYGSYDNGWGITRSELGYMYYVNLQNLPDYAYNSSFVPGAETDPALIGLTNTSFTDAADGDSVSFLNLQPGAYWFQELSFILPNCVCTSILSAWYFNFDNGYQDVDAWREDAGSSMISNSMTSNWYAPHSWAVRDGDVSPVPVPAALWLFGSALLTLAGVPLARRRR